MAVIQLRKNGGIQSAAVGLHEMVMGVLGEQERTLDRGSIGRLIVHGSGRVERQVSKSRELGLGVAIDPRA